MPRIAVADGGRAPLVRPEIAASWSRTTHGGLDPEVAAESRVVREAPVDTRLLRASTPVLDRLSSVIEDHQLSVMLADETARLMRVDFGCASMAPPVEAFGAVPGAIWDEESTGANALALPHATRLPAFVRGDEHYLAGLKHYSCYGRPIINPVTKRLEGVIDMMMIGAAVHPLVKPVIDDAAHEIEQALGRDVGIRTQRLIQAFDQAAAHPASAVVALGRDRVLQSTRASAVLSAEDIVMLRSISTEQTQSARIPLILQSGERVTARFQPVEGSGGVFVLQVRDHRTIRRQPGTATHFERVESWLQRSSTTVPSHVITGDAGTGRSTVLDELAGRFGGQILQLGDVAVSARHDALTTALSQAVTRPAVLDDVDLLDDAALRDLDDALAARVPVLAASRREPERPGLERVLGRFRARLDLPALRETRHEVPNLIQAMAGPGVMLRFEDAAIRALEHYPWPGNLVELRSVTEQILPRRGSVVTLADLPERFRRTASDRVRTPWQRAQCEAIWAALEATGGNKARAAEYLGISRSALYHHLREYGIHV